MYAQCGRKYKYIDLNKLKWSHIFCDVCEKRLHLPWSSSSSSPLQPADGGRKEEVETSALSLVRQTEESQGGRKHWVTHSRHTRTNSGHQWRESPRFDRSVNAAWTLSAAGFGGLLCFCGDVRRLSLWRPCAALNRHCSVFPVATLWSGLYAPARHPALIHSRQLWIIKKIRREISSCGRGWFHQLTASRFPAETPRGSWCSSKFTHDSVRLAEIRHRLLILPHTEWQSCRLRASTSEQTAANEREHGPLWRI